MAHSDMMLQKMISIVFVGGMEHPFSIFYDDFLSHTQSLEQ